MARERRSTICEWLVESFRLLTCSGVQCPTCGRLVGPLTVGSIESGYTAVDVQDGCMCGRTT